MKLKGLAFVLLRLLAIYIFIQGLNQLAHIIASVSPLSNIIKDPAWTFFGPLFFLGLVYILISILIWIYTSKFANYVTDGQEEVADLHTQDYKPLYLLGFTLIGLFIVITSLPELFSMVTNLIAYRASEIPIQNIGIWSYFVNSGLKLLLGIWLVFGSKGIYAMIMNVRKLGNSDKNEF